MKKKICIFTSMIYPVPAVKGGAVEGLVELLIRLNEKYNQLDLTVVSVNDLDAQEVSKRYKHTKFVFIDRKRTSDKLLSKKIFIYINKIWMKLRGRTLISMPFVKRAMKIIRNQEFDKYILEGGGDCYNFGYLNKKIQKEKLIVHFHGEVPGEAAIQNWFGKCITVSNYIARKLICNGVVNCNKVTVLPNCFDRDSMDCKISREEIRKKYNIANSDIVYIYWGRLLPEKGVYEMLEAYNLMGNEKKNTKLLIIGNANFGYESHSEYDKKLENICSKDGMKENVIFTGFVPHDEMGSILSACDIGIIPSIWDDPAPLTIFEGLSKGLPLIAGAVGGIPEIIQNMHNGILVNWTQNYSQELSDRMIKLKNDVELRIKLSKNALESIGGFTPEKYYERFVRLME